MPAVSASAASAAHAAQPRPRNSLSRRRIASDSSRSTRGAVRLSPENLVPLSPWGRLAWLALVLAGLAAVATATTPRRRAVADAARLAFRAAADGDEPRVEIRELPSLAQGLARSLDCAVLGMRYRVGDDFARDSVLALYRLLLEKGRALPEALQLALADTLKDGRPRAPALSWVTPVLFGPRAADLRLVPPRPATARSSRSTNSTRSSNELYSGTGAMRMTQG